MYKFIIKRILFLIPTIIGVTFIIYAVMNITPGEPGRAILGTGVSQADIDAYNHALGYDLPFLQKFGLYIKRMVIDQDFGISYVTKQNAFHEIWPRFLVTLKLSFLGVFLSAIIGIPLGIQAAVKQYKLADTIPSLLAFLLAAVPTFVLGLAMLFLFCDRLNWLPSYGIDTFKHYIMPALAISLPPAAQNFRFTKSSMLEAIRQDYVHPHGPRQGRAGAHRDLEARSEKRAAAGGHAGGPESGYPDLRRRGGREDVLHPRHRQSDRGSH